MYVADISHLFSVKDLKKNDILWVKYGRHPFWPSLVLSYNFQLYRIVYVFERFTFQFSILYTQNQ